MQEQYYGTGRRKSCTARVFLRKGEGNIVVNGKPLDEYFGRATARMVVKQPLKVVDVENKFLELQSNSTDIDRIIQESTSKRNLLLEQQQTIGKVKGLDLTN